MSAKLPPKPKENRSNKGSGEKHEALSNSDTRPDKTNPDKQSQQANTRINTTHQGLQQDR